MLVLSSSFGEIFTIYQNVCLFNIAKMLAYNHGLTVCAYKLFGIRLHKLS
jgi:hypothetical protein